MKKIAPIFAILMVLGMMFTACENGVQEIKGDIGGSVAINVPKAPAVSAVSPTLLSNKNGYIIRWDAVAEDLNYIVYVQPEGKKSYLFDMYGQNAYKMNDSDGWGLLYQANDNIDKWSAMFATSSILPRLNDADLDVAAELAAELEGNGFHMGKFPSAGKYRFGVRSYYIDGRSNAVASDIKWSDYVTITSALVETDNVTASITGGKISGSWDKFDGAEGYHLQLRIDGTYAGYLGWFGGDSNITVSDKEPPVTFTEGMSVQIGVETVGDDVTDITVVGGVGPAVWSEAIVVTAGMLQNLNDCDSSEAVEVL